ncbi:hypothetical protein A0H81_11649 [Grifola frondosa]|uniref:Uncharacterized protein n=1 Tax=Grifola frondosa TaxID=5627 RepID=A0A1C7LU98_GRIFR|nr:hypothetical protein A0H81_11649 [Grifola frondosa]
MLAKNTSLTVSDIFLGSQSTRMRLLNAKNTGFITNSSPEVCQRSIRRACKNVAFTSPDVVPYLWPA